jgi:hypothetical protein
VLFIKMLPDSPRYLASVGRKEEARDLLNRIREGHATSDEIDREYLEIITTARESKPSSPVQFAKILFGKGGRPGTNLARRAWLCIWLQIMASWTGITVSGEQRNQCLEIIAYFEIYPGGYSILSGLAQTGWIQ